MFTFVSNNSQNFVGQTKKTTSMGTNMITNY